MARELRDYQVDILNRIVEAGRGGCKRALACMPTGSGKTMLAGAFVERAVAAGQPVLALAHRRELVEQMVRSFSEQVGIKIGTVQAGVHNPYPGARVQVASIQTLLARGTRPPAHLLVIDEAHHLAAKRWSAILADYPDAFALGLTATPERGDGKPLTMFEELFAGPQPSELIAANHLVPSDIIAPHAALTEGIAWDPVESYLKHARGRRCINFAKSVEHSQAIVTGLLNAGVPAAHLDMDTHKTLRGRILKQFAQGHLHVLSNVNLLTEGVDIPSCEVTMLSCAVGSLGKYLQAVGRSLRPAPGKGSALLLDLRGACHLFGAPDIDRYYALEGDEGLRGAKPNLTDRTCKQCDGIRPLGPGPCPLCGFSTAAAPGSSPAIEGVELSVIKHTKKDPACVEEYVRLLMSAERRGQPPRAASEAYWKRHGCFPEGTWIAWYEAWKAGRWASAVDVPRPWPLESLGLRQEQA